MASLYYSFLPRTTNQDFAWCIVYVMKNVEQFNIQSSAFTMVYENLKSKNEKIEKIKKRKLTHRLSKSMAADVKQREYWIRSIREKIKSFIHGLDSPEKDAAEILSPWVNEHKKKFSNRAIFDVTVAIDIMEIFYRDDEKIRNGVSLLGMDEIIGKLFELNRTINSNFLERGLDNKKNLGETVKLRTELYADFKRLMKIIEVFVEIDNPESESFNDLFKSVEDILEVYKRRMIIRRMVIQRRKKRKLEAERIKAERAQAAVGENMSHFLDQPGGVLETKEINTSAKMFSSSLLKRLPAPATFSGLPLPTMETSSFGVVPIRKKKKANSL